MVPCLWLCQLPSHVFQFTWIFYELSSGSILCTQCRHKLIQSCFNIMEIIKNSLCLQLSVLWSVPLIWTECISEITMYNTLFVSKFSMFLHGLGQRFSSHLSFFLLQDPAGIFDLIEVVGNGTYGQVYKVKYYICFLCRGLGQILCVIDS